LTGIQQDWVNNGISLIDTLGKYNNFLLEKKLFTETESFAFVTCGDWDLKTMLPSQCRYLRINRPKYFNRWVNIKQAFSDFYNTSKRDMVGMLEYLIIGLTGRHHSGIDDCRNITKIVQKMIQDGCVLENTMDITPITNPTNVLPNIRNTPESEKSTSSENKSGKKERKLVPGEYIEDKKGPERKFEKDTK